MGTNTEYEEIHCHACQGGGCPTCNGYGWYHGPKIMLKIREEVK